MEQTTTDKKYDYAQKWLLALDVLKYISENTDDLKIITAISILFEQVKKIDEK